MKRRQIGLFWAMLGILLSVGMISKALAEDEDDDIQESFESEQIDVDGNFSQREQIERERRKRRSMRDNKREIRRMKREDRQEQRKDYIDDKIEDIKARNAEKIDKKIGKIRLKNEKKLLKNLFSGESEENNEVRPVPTPPPAPVPPPLPPPPVVEEKKGAELEQISVNLGSSFFDDIDFSSDASFSFKILGKYNRNFSWGIGLGWTNMGIEVRDDNFRDYAKEPYDRYSRDGKGIGKAEVDYSRFHIDFMGKAYLFDGAVVRPYLGLGIGWNSVGLNYDEKKYEFNALKYEETRSMSEYLFSGMVGFGSEVVLTEVVGLDFAIGFRKSLTTPFQNAEIDGDGDNYVDRYEEILKIIGEKIEKSNETVLSLGVSVYL